MKRVRWTKSVRVSLVAVAMIGAASMMTTAQSNDPTGLPRLELKDVMYVGGFRLPAGVSNGDDFSIGGRPLAFNPAGPSLFVGSRAGRVAEISIPSVVNSANVEALPFSTFLQPFADPTEGRLYQVGSDGVSIDGLLVQNNRLYGTASTYYDANNTQRVSHYSHSLKLDEPSFKGWSSVWQADKTGFVSGMMANVPSAWQALLGGPAVTGQCCIPIAARTSWGPAAFAFDPSQIGQSLISASPLLYYTSGHATLGPWDASSPTYGASTTMGGVVIIPGTRTALYFGANGLGPNCYGDGTGDQSLHGTKAPDGSTYCYDPSNSAKGSHAYPYRYQIWAYDLKDFADVKAGKKQPWDIEPYGVWPFELPTPEPTVRLGAATYDPATQTIYISQLLADKDGYAYRSVIHALYVNLRERVADGVGVTISTNLTSPQATGTPVRFSASMTGGIAPFQYKWLVSDGASWQAATGWTTSSEYVWTPTTANSGYRIGVYVRSSGNTSDTPEAATDIAFPIGGSRASAVSLVANKTAPQLPGTTIQWTATPVGGTAPHQYLWWIYDGATWSQSGNWTTGNTFAWTPTTANASYRVAVWVRSNGNTSDHEAGVEATFAIGAPVAPPPTASAVSLKQNVASPQPLGTSLTWTASVTGGAAPFQYQWWTHDGVNWTSQPWTPANTFAWKPATAGNYRVAVWVKSAGSTAGYEASVESWFTITGSSGVVPSTVTSIKLAANLAAPQRPNTTVVWTATPTGGTAPHQYQWWVFDGVSWVSQPWTTSNTFVWTPTTANANYRIAVYVRSAGNNGSQENSTEAWFGINP